MATAVVMNHTTDADGVTTAAPMMITLDDDFAIEFDASETQAKAGSKGRFGQKSEAQKKADFRLFWAENPTIVRLGHILSESYKGHPLAAYLAAGSHIPVSGLGVRLSDGSKIDPKNVSYISLEPASVAKWGCPSCLSAHGSGVGSSSNGGVNAKALAKVNFFYAVESRTLFSISGSCMTKYVEGEGLHKQIVDTLPVAPNGIGKKAKTEKGDTK